MINSFKHHLNSFKHYFTKKENKIQMNSEKDNEKNIRFYLFSAKEWVSSIYSYNKSSTKALVSNNLLLNILVKGYLNMLEIKRTVFNRRRDNKIRYSADRVYTSKTDLEHTNSKLNIWLTVYNKKKALLEHRLRRFILLIKFWKIVIGNKKITIPYYKNRLLHTLKRNFSVLNKWNITFFEEKTSLFSYLLKTKWRSFYFDDYVPSIKKSTAAHLHSFYNLSNYINKRLKKVYKLEKTLSHLTKSLSFNTSLFTSLILYLNHLGLISLLEKLYGKKTRINLVESRAVHLNSDVFASVVALKLRDRKNKVVRVLRKAVLNMVKIPDLHTLITFDDNGETLNKNNVVNNIKQQVVSGVRFEASGRLTRRLTAMRAVFKYRYAGSLKNIRSSFNNESTTMLRGYIKSNLQQSLVNSKTRNGTFGLKGWVSSHLFNFKYDQLSIRYIVKPIKELSSSPLQSAMFTINKRLVIGLISSLITAAIGYGIRLILLNYLEYDVFTNLDNWIVSLSYFCSLGGIRFLIGEFVKENFFLTSTGDNYITGLTNMTNSTAVTSSRGHDPWIGSSSGATPGQNDPGIGNNDPGIGSSSGATPGNNTTGIGNTITGADLTTQHRLELEKKIVKVQADIVYFNEQHEEAKWLYWDLMSKRSQYENSGRGEQWLREHAKAKSALDQTETNLTTELKVDGILRTKWANGDYDRFRSTSTSTKRGFNDSSMANDDYNRPNKTR
jgi:hypothetical protein